MPGPPCCVGGTGRRGQNGRANGPTLPSVDGTGEGPRLTCRRFDNGQRPPRGFQGEAENGRFLLAEIPPLRGRGVLRH